MITTRPMMLFVPETWDNDYDGSVEPDADTPAWTRSGADCASSDGDVLTIASAGAAASYYYMALTGVAAADVLWMRVVFKIASGFVGELFAIRSSTIGKKITVKALGDSSIRFEGAANVDATLDLTSDYVTMWIMLAAGGWRAWTTDDMTELADGAPATEASAERVEFGKLDAENYNQAIYFDEVDHGEGDAFIFPYAPKGWQPHESVPKRIENVSADGTVETVHLHNARYITCDMQVVSDANIALLRPLWENYMSHGTAFFLAQDYSVHSTGWYTVIDASGKFVPTADAAVPTHWSVKQRLRVVS